MFKISFNTKIDYYVAFLISIKFIFTISALGHLLLSHTNSQLSKYDPSFLYWKERTEFIFIISMSILLIYYFYFNAFDRLQKSRLHFHHIILTAQM